MPRVAHSVRTKHTRFRDAGHNNAARAHAKRKQVAITLGDQRVVRSTKKIQVTGFAVLELVDVGLRVLDANSQLERFRFQWNSRRVHLFVRVASTVADSQNHMLRRNRAAGSIDAADDSISDVEAFESATEFVLSAQAFDVSAEVSADHGQFVAAEVRSVFVDQRLAAAAFDKPIQNPIDIGPGYAARQFAVAKTARSTFAKQVVILTFEVATTIEPADGWNAFFDRLAAFDD